MSVADRPIGDFLAAVAAGAVTPGGGAAMAVAGAAGAALGEMVCANTVGGDVEPETAAVLEGARDDLAAARETLLALADEDVAAVEELMGAYGADDPERRAEATEAATVVPLEIAEAVAGALEAIGTAVEHGNPNAVPDGVIGAHLSHAALEAATYTVAVNLPHLEDEATAEAFADRAGAAERAGAAHLEVIQETAVAG